MKTRFFPAFLCFLFSVLKLSSAYSQTGCTVAGWATQNGGTTGGGSATPITVSTLADLQTQAAATGAKVIYVSGSMGSGVSTRVPVSANKTIIGLPGAQLFGGFDVKNTSNVIIRNMKVRGPGAVDVNGVDCITIQTATNIWIDHCELWDGQDGNMDITNDANYVTVSWTKFSYTSASTNHQFCNLIGSSDTHTSDRGKLKITFVNNWWAPGCKERMPRVRFGQVHVVNNYFGCTGNNHCVRAGIEADLLVEGNYFDGVSTPIDLFENNFTAVTMRNNTFVSTTGNTAGSGTAFTPTYTLAVAPSANVKAFVTDPTCGAGATMSSPTACCGGVPVTYTLSTNSAPAAGGSVSASPSASSYNAGTVVSLTASAAAGYTFTGWSGDASGTAATISITMDANKVVTANFQQNVTTYTLSTTASPAAGGNIARSPNAANYAAGTVVTLTATAAAGYTFSGWSGDAAGTSASVTITMDANKIVTASFQQVPVTYTLTTNSSPAAGGTIARSPNAATYAAGTSVSLTATPAAGYTFIGWSGAATGSSNPLSIVMDADKTVSANFQTTGGTVSTIRIEDNATSATGLCSYDGVLSSNSGAANTKVINLTNSSAKGISWSINTPAGGSYSFNWRYTNGGSGNAITMKLIVNGVTINSALGFPKTSSSTAFLNTTASITLAAGANTVRLETTVSSATADIDWLEVTGDTPSPGNCGATGRFATSINTDAAIQSTEAIGIAPNPARNGAQITFVATSNEQVTLLLHTASGRIVKNFGRSNAQAGSNSRNLRWAQLAPGLYFVTVLHQSGARDVRALVIE